MANQVQQHKQSIQCLVDVTEAMLDAMEKNKIETKVVAKKPEFAVLIHFLKSILDGELNIPNELTETIREKAEDLNLELVMDRKLH